MLIRLAVCLVISAMGCRGSRPLADLAAVEQLTCVDSTNAYAYYARASAASLPDTSAGLAVRVQRGNPPLPVEAADVQVWGPRSGAGSPGSPSGTTTFGGRDPGLHRLQLRVTPDERWIYLATLRGGFADTVIVQLDAKCTLIWRGSGSGLTRS